MVEQKIDVKIRAIDLDRVLSPDEGEPLAQFEQKSLQVVDQTRFEFAFVERLFDRKKIEYVRIFQRLLCQVGLRCGQHLLKVRDRPALPLVGRPT